MTKIMEAIYEQGVLRLKGAISLAEGTSVEVIIITNEPAPAGRTPAQILAAIAAMPVEADSDSFSGRDHDKILYGEKDEQ